MLYVPVDRYVIEYSQHSDKTSIFHGYDPNNEYLPFYVSAKPDQLRSYFSAMFDHHHQNIQALFKPRWRMLARYRCLDRRHNLALCRRALMEWK